MKDAKKQKIRDLNRRIKTVERERGIAQRNIRHFKRMSLYHAGRLSKLLEKKMELQGVIVRWKMPMEFTVDEKSALRKLIAGRQLKRRQT